ncbi:hypothetical protein LQK80_36065 [Bacillus thuringiensis]|nr:hypothetical protein [Bacillus thuringiensis]
MSRRRFFDLREGDRIKVFSAGIFEGEGIFIRFAEEKDEDFIFELKTIEMIVTENGNVIVRITNIVL